MDNQDQSIGQYFALHGKLIMKGFLGALWIATIIMFILMSIGIYKISKGAILEFQEIEPSGLIGILGGVELIFVSPLLYLLILSLTKYISATRPEVDNGTQINSIENKTKFINFAMMEIINVKTLMVGLFISILTLHSIQYILRDESNSPPVLFILAIFVILIVYYFVLDKLAEGFRGFRE